MDLEDLVKGDHDHVDIVLDDEDFLKMAKKEAWEGMKYGWLDFTFRCALVLITGSALLGVIKCLWG